MNEAPSKEEIEFLRDLYIEDLDRPMSFGKGSIYGEQFKPRVGKRILNGFKKIQIKEQVDLNKFDNVWVWSDQHFGHYNIIDFCDRPFMGTMSMDEHMVSNFNEYVGENDCSIWVGDVSFDKMERTNQLLDRCNGYKILVVGNHDIGKHGGVAQMNFDEHHFIFCIDDDIRPLVITHYPMYNLLMPWFNICGHVHNNRDVTLTDQQYNVGVDVQNFKPENLEDIKDRLKARYDAIDEKQRKLRFMFTDNTERIDSGDI